MVLNISFLIWGLLLKERILLSMVTLKGKNLLSIRSKFFPLRVTPNEEGDGLRLSHEKVHPLLS